MNSSKVSALFRDALYQVLDNWVFRILVILAGIVVLFTFVFGFRETELVFLFGFERWSYESLLAAMDAPAQRDAQGLLIGVLNSLIFEQVIGKFGVMFCIAATAFFVPRMVEKGAADVLFHKPLSRLVFYLHRYVVGLLFVGILSSIMAVGIYAGLAISSGWHDPGILMAAPLLTYVFGLIYAVTMFIGVVTRSTVASILLSILFFACNGCVHMTWHGLGASEQIQRQQIEMQEESEEAVPEEEPPAVFVYFKKTIDVLHYLLPKTSDAAVLASKVRRAAEGPLYIDDEELVSVFEMAEGFEQLEPASLGVPADMREALGEAVFAFEGPVETMLPVEEDEAGDTGEADQAEAASDEAAWETAGVRATLLVRPIRMVERTRRGEVTERPESLTQAGGLLQDAIEDNGLGDARNSLTSFGTNPNGTGFGGTRVITWEDDDEVLIGTHALVFKGMSGEHIFTLWVEDGVAAPSEKRRVGVNEALGEMMGLSMMVDPYEAKFTFDAPWRYNILFSVGSSLAFVVVFLLLGWWRLSRIDF